MATNWRDMGNTTLEAYIAEFTRLNSPMLGEAKAIYEAAKPHSALCIAMMWVESKHHTITSVPKNLLNPLHQKNSWQEQQEGKGVWKKFPSYEAAITHWKNNLTSPTGPYKDTVTLDDLIHVYAPDDDGNDEAIYVDHIERIVATLPKANGDPPMPITFGRVPHPGYLDRPIVKGEGQGWDNLGQRQPKFVVLHRMIGSLWGTDSYFRMAGVNALTDYGVGVAATDGADAAGTIIRWNDPRGVRSGWASGPVNGAYGDGLAIVNKYGLNAVNRDGVSIEISGNYETAVDAKAFEEIAQLMAYWWDQMQIPHTSAPTNPTTGISAVIWHQEFTLGTGKVCPGNVVMDATTGLVARSTAILKQHQEATETTVTTPRPPAPQPAPKYPEGMDAELAAQWFGKVVFNGAWYTFDPNGSLSRLWLAEGAKTGSYPALTSVETFGTRTYFRFGSGLTIWRANATAPVRVLKA
jgi:hypothetical protein